MPFLLLTVTGRMCMIKLGVITSKAAITILNDSVGMKTLSLTNGVVPTTNPVTLTTVTNGFKIKNTVQYFIVFSFNAVQLVRTVNITATGGKVFSISLMFT
ncbi:unnamed protein product [Gordionus sp. m RMFG-2023]